MSAPLLRCIYGFCCNLFLLLSICQVIQAIHEDQVGLNDWSLQFIGRPLEVLVSATQTGSSKSLAYVYTEQNVLAAVDLKYGEIVWRQLFENNENGTVSSGVLLDEEVCVLLNRGRLLRCFDTVTGAFKWERSFGSQDGHTGKCTAVWDLKDKKSLNPLAGVACANDDRVVFFSRHGHAIWESKSAKARKRFVFQSQSGDLVVVGLNENKIAIKRLAPSSGEAKNAGFDRSAIVSPATTDCRLIQPAAQVSPYLVCYDGSTNRLFSQSIGEAEKSQLDFRLESLGDLSRKPGDEVLLQAFAADGLIGLSSAGESLLLQLAADGQIKSLKKVSGVFMGSSETDILTVELSDQLASIVSSKYDGTSLVPQAVDTQAFAFPSSFGSLRSALMVASRDSTPIKPAFLFWTEGDVLGFVSQGKITFKREEGLADLTVAAIVDLPISDIEALVEEEFEEKGSFPVRFTKRLISQGLQLKKLVEINVKRVMSGLRIGQYIHKEQLERDYFNTHKIIVAANDHGKVFGLDSRNGDIIYSFLMKDFVKPKDRDIQFYMQRTGAHAPFPSQAVLVGADKHTGNGMLFFFDCITGEQLDQPVTLSRPIQQSGLIPVMSSHHLEAIFLLDSDLNLSIFPTDLDVPEISTFIKTSLHLLDVCTKTGIARGYRAKLVNKSWKAVEVWSATLLASGESILAVASKRPHDFVHSQGRVLADRRVLYKYINPNLVAITVQGLDEAKKPYVKAIAVDGVTGRVVLSQIHRRARGPTLVVHAEHWIMYSFWNEKVRTNEIGVVEMYRGFDKPNKTYFSSLESFEKPELSAAAFKLPGFASAISDTVTVEGITHKNLIVALASGSIMQIPKVLLDPRRPMFPTQAEREEGLIPYAPDLPLVTENIINYYRKVYRIRGIKTGGAGLESISLVFAHGLDLFFTRVTPSALFDVLSDSFDYWILTVVMLVMTIASIIVRHMANGKTLEQAWK